MATGSSRAVARATFYAFGERLDTLPSEIEAQLLAGVKEQFPNLVPTTYEASKAYLDEEILKPEGQRDLTREMCMIMPLKLPKGRDIVLKVAKLSIHLTEGCLIVYPTIEFPPTSFGTHDNPYSNMLVDSTAPSNPVTVNILMAYFTRAGDKLKWTGDRDNTKEVKLDFSFR
ncbi:hypothetical protein F5887DRAFT_961991 [Amanita rubescens]|nr:hypothetical protein F5887DRAFT_961991 [Amanita rubescens]